MGLSEAKRLHKELWNWLSENPNKIKKDWPKWETMDNIIIGDCFACELCKMVCSVCPIIWPHNRKCISESGLFYQWVECEDDEESAILAGLIRDLEWRI